MSNTTESTESSEVPAGGSGEAGMNPIASIMVRLGAVNLQAGAVHFVSLPNPGKMGLQLRVDGDNCKWDEAKRVHVRTVDGKELVSALEIFGNANSITVKDVYTPVGVSMEFTSYTPRGRRVIRDLARGLGCNQPGAWLYSPSAFAARRARMAAKAIQR